MKVVLATGNAGKVKELSELLADSAIKIIPQTDFDFPEAIEDGLSFIENAIIKARHAAAHTGLPAIADDSGIEVAYLDGAPGIHSARYAGNSTDNNQKLLAALDNVPTAQRAARFRCSLAFMRHAADPSPVIAEGSWDGVILEAPEGAGGFGYDPVFYVPTHGCSAAALSKEEKNKISHRGQALQKLRDRLLPEKNF